MNQRPPESSENLGTSIAMFFLIVSGVGLIGIGALASLPVMGLLIVIAAFVLLGFVNYWLWGKWLIKPRDDDDSEF